jgi:hypothetical protein
MADTATLGGHAGVMVTALLALFVLITVAWALHDIDATLERHNPLSIGMTSIPTPLVARFIRRYTAVYGLGTGYLSKRAQASTTRDVRAGIVVGIGSSQPSS